MRFGCAKWRNFEGETPEAAEAAFRESVEGYIEYLMASM